MLYRTIELQKALVLISLITRQQHTKPVIFILPFYSVYQFLKKRKKEKKVGLHKNGVRTRKPQQLHKNSSYGVRTRKPQQLHKNSSYSVCTRKPQQLHKNNNQCLPGNPNSYTKIIATPFTKKPQRYTQIIATLFTKNCTNK